MMSEDKFLAKGHWNCPVRLEIKDMDWSDDPHDLKETMLENKTNGEPTAYCRAYEVDGALAICQRIRASGDCPALVMIRASGKVKQK